MNSLRFSLALGFALVAGAVSMPAMAQGDVEVGKVVVWHMGAYGTRVGAVERSPLYLHDAVYSDETVETVRKGVVKLQFLDETELHIGESSAVTLDRYVFDPSANSGEMAISFGKGVFRFISGQINRDDYTINTPAAAIGIRGTNLGIAVAGNGRTTIDVFGGVIGVTPTGTGQTTEVGRFMTVTVDPDGGVEVEDFPPMKTPLVEDYVDLDFIEVPEQESGAGNDEPVQESSSYDH